ncbi:MAG: PAS domain S-box protein [Verrucomicrobia bacterium]|nr:PAS domain S-box protein [Verrucomicrobiota bacterium]
MLVSEKIRVLHLEDNPADAELVRAELIASGLSIDYRQVDNRQEFVAALDSPIDIILADYRLPQFDALQALRTLQQHGLSLPFIVITGTLGDELAAECVKLGATDFLLKDRLARLGSAVRGALEKARAEERVREARQQYNRLFESLPEGAFVTDAKGHLIAYNPALLRLFGLKENEAQSLEMTSFYIKPDMRANLLDELNRKGSVVDFETTMRRSDDSEFTASLTASAIRGREGGVAGLQGIVRDVTIIRKAQEKERQLIDTLEGKNKELESHVRQLEGLNRMFQQHIEQHSKVLDALNGLVAATESKSPKLAETLRQAKAIVQADTAERSELQGLMEKDRS